MLNLRLPGRMPVACIFASAIAMLGCQSTDSLRSTEQLTPKAPSFDVSPSGATVVITEMIPNPTGDDTNTEWFEVYNAADTSVNLQNFKFGSNNDADFTVTSSYVLAAHGYGLFVRSASGPAAPSSSVPRFVYPNAFTLNNGGNPATDWLVLRTAAGVQVDSVAYAVRNSSNVAGSFTPANGASRAKKALVIDCSTLADNGAWANSTANSGTNSDKGTPGLPNSDVTPAGYTYTGSCGTTSAPGVVTTVTVTPNPTTVSVNGTRTLTATGRDAGNNTVASTYTWSTSDDASASVSTSGVVTGHAQGAVVTISARSANNVTGTAQVTVTAPASNVTVSGRSNPLPVGFQTQLFASGTDGSGNAVTTVTWSTSDASILTVDQNGVITAAGLGSAQVIATTPDNSTGRTTVSTETVNLTATAREGHNVEFGSPFDGTPSNDVIIPRKQYTLSYNPARGGPNWVSWNLDQTHLGSLDRCNCFTADTALVRLGYPAYTTADYVAGGLWDRGHMEPSADQTTSDGENAYTFFLSNTLPQKHDLNAGPWEKLETALRDSAKTGREVYIIAGGIFTNGVGLGTLNNAGKIAIPDSTWKIAIIVPAGAGLSDVHTQADASVIAVNMPNVVGIASNTWQQYATTIAKLEASTGYNFLDLLDEGVECKIEVRNCLPVPKAVPANGSTSVAVGSAFTLNTSGSDADGSDGPWKLLIEWGDGTTFSSTLLSLPTDAKPLARTKTWTTPGTYTVKVTITDKKGGQGVTTLQVTVS